MTTVRALRVVIVGGGTGGHVIPGLAVARELREQHRAECMFVGTPRGMETRLVPRAGFPLELIEAGPLKNVSPLTRLKTVANLPRSVLHCLGLLRRWKPDVVISVGGYASGPGALAALLLRVPVLAFEPNYVPGLANRCIAPFVAGAAVQFDATASIFRNGEVTGVPIRREFFEVPAFDDRSKQDLLVFGGSQGARAINQTVIAALPLLTESLPKLRIVHQTGPRDFESTKAAYASLPSSSRLASSETIEFIDDMPSRFADAQLILCRSGASTIAEVAAAGRAAIFVPLPTAADDHQTRNADALVHAQAAELLPQAKMTAGSLTETLVRLFASPDQLAGMGASARRLAYPDAAKKIAEMAVRAAR